MRQQAEQLRADNAATVAQAASDAYTVEDLCRDWLRAKHGDWKASTERSNTRIVNVEIVPRWGKRSVASLRRGEIAEARDAVKSKGGTLSNRWLWCVKALLDYAVDREVIDASPAANLKRAYKEKPRERVLSTSELRTLGRALPNADIRDDYRDIVHLLLLTGVRNSEACDALDRQR